MSKRLCCKDQYTLTNAECKYKLCGIITAPTMPTACISSFDSQFEHHGINIPLCNIDCARCRYDILHNNKQKYHHSSQLNTCKLQRSVALTSYPNVTAMTVIRKPNKNSSLRRPYLSSIKNEKVSMMVISVPAHNGILSL